MSYEIRAMSFAEIMDTGFRIVRQHFGLIIGSPRRSTCDRDPGRAGRARARAGAGAVGERRGRAGGVPDRPRALCGRRCRRSCRRPSRSPSVRSTSAGAPRSGSRSAWAPPCCSDRRHVHPGGHRRDDRLGPAGDPGVYLFPLLPLVWQVMVLERRYGFAAMGRSRELMRGSLLRGFGSPSRGPSS